RLVTSSGAGSGSLNRVPGLCLVIGLVEMASVGAGCGTVPGALQETVTSWAGLLPQVSRRCSGVVVGGPLGAVAANARGGRTVAPASAVTAPAPTVPMMNLRRVNPGLPADSAAF